MSPFPTHEELVRGVRAGDRSLLARAITRVESERPDHQEQAQALLTALLPSTGGARRVGISGVPGVGKSTFIDALGTHLTGLGRKVAVLAVDPSSTVSHGSILGDKTRMARLSRDPNAFIRPSPTAGTLGGVARKTRETILLCEAAGFDVVLVETVGVGQSETVVADMVDFYLVLMLAGAGDELQGIKRGILEVADMLAINKADGDNRGPAERARKDYEMALRLMRGHGATWDPPVACVSARDGTGVPEVWAQIERHREVLGDGLEERRHAQLVRWMWSLVTEGLMRAFREHPGVARGLPELEAAVRRGELPATAAARELLGRFRGD